jgi:hypothetical protein
VTTVTKRLTRKVGDTAPFVLDLESEGAPYIILSGSAFFVTMVGRGGEMSGVVAIDEGECDFDIGASRVRYVPESAEVSLPGRYLLQLYGTVPGRALRCFEVEVELEPNVRAIA